MDTVTVGNDFPRQQERVRELLVIYESLPNGAGKFGALMMRQALKRAYEAAIGGDIIEILRAYEELKGFKE